MALKQKNKLMRFVAYVVCLKKGEKHMGEDVFQEVAKVLKGVAGLLTATVPQLDYQKKYRGCGTTFNIRRPCMKVCTNICRCGESNPGPPKSKYTLAFLATFTFRGPFLRRQASF